MKKKRIRLSSNASARTSLVNSTLQQAIAQETVRAQTAEESIGNTCASIAAEVEKNSNAIDKETQRAKESESKLSASISGKLSAKSITWGKDSSIDNYVTQGFYIINGERLSADDGLPIINSNPGHTIAATLIVTDSTINSGKMCVTQFLMMSNRLGNDGNMYVRTATGNTSGLSWGAWGRMATNIEVGQVNSLDSFIDNGIYSGIYTQGTSMETFVMIVINNYLAAGSLNTTRSISQFKYALALDGSVTFQKRSGGAGVLGGWTDISTPPVRHSSNRPSNPTTGYCFFDDDLGKPLWWNGSSWVDATGKAA